ncbi:MAG TPA: alpha/beta hydrolase [Symbiobacteriaceae bacterium]|nr:alpha/beta hydrolase [Symbiobacteriaceae bacterium]
MSSGHQEFIELANRKLHYESAGTGAPVIILEAGAGCPSDTWNPIWPELIKLTRVVRYDRAGIGKSDPAPQPRTVADMAADLDALLQSASIQGPYILVGHSLGGLLVRYFAHRHPEEVVGMMLIDSSHHDHSLRQLAVLPAASPDEPEPIAMQRRMLTDATTLSREGFNFLQVQQAVSQCSPLGSLPLTVLCQALPDREKVMATTSPGFPVDLACELHRVNAELQKDLAALSTEGVHHIVEQSGHFIHIDRPDVVVAAVASLLNRVRG